ncbi:feruloyl-CoA synthase [Roseibium algae]|uniref:Feruloyl-CoA synthase n=1 Tax=Roseibium algae TaxID=3123038 RepID=A0ABU8TNW3_9HYPH
MNEANTHDVDFWSPVIAWETRKNGATYVWREDKLGGYPSRITDKLDEWAEADPDRTWMAARDNKDVWHRVSYGKALKTVRSIAQALIDLGLSTERPVLILSGNSIEHALLALAAQYVGIPSSAVSPAYSLLSTDFGKLKDIAQQITPGLVFTDKLEGFEKAIETVFNPGIPILTLEANLPGRPCLTFNDLCTISPTEAVDAANAAVNPDTVAKFLFTSGTTGSPKAVIQTQRMLCSNQAMVADCYAFLKKEPPVLVDWAPWNHVAAGNKVFNLALYHGGTYYIDEGKPTPKAIGKTIKNLKEISPTWYFNVPAGYEMLVNAMYDDEALRDSFFKNMKYMMYAGAGMAQHTWDDLNRFSAKAKGSPVLIATGLGATETAPFALALSEVQAQPGNVGIPAQGTILKLVPCGEKLEARLKGPNVTPGYWRNEELSRKAFDDEGFYCLGDALRHAVPGDPSKGFYFDGRIAENFKLQTGTWVAVGALRGQLVNDLGGLVRDAVIAGENQEELAALIMPAMPALRTLVPDEERLSNSEILMHDDTRKALSDALAQHVQGSTGSATRVMRLLFLDTEPSFDKGEITDKGSINQRAVLSHRSQMIELLFSDHPDVIHPTTQKTT